MQVRRSAGAIQACLPSPLPSRRIVPPLLLLLPILTLNAGLAQADDADAAAGVDGGGILSEVQIVGVMEHSGLGQAVPDVGSPQSLISEQVIREIVSPVGDYSTVANLATGFVSSAPNGPGFDAAKGQSLRGFVDGQFNVTLDGIPFQDPDSFLHHSTSYFPTAVLGHMVIDRSPGSAVDLGYANSGGSVNAYSLDIPEAARVRSYGSYGSFATSLIVATLNTAAPRSCGEAGVLVNIEHSQSDGAMDNSTGWKNDFFVKGVGLLGDVRLSALYDYDQYHFYNPGSLTTADLAQYGSSFGFDTNPASPNYYDWADTHRDSDFGYIGADVSFAGQWHLQDKLYTFSYRNTGLSLKGDQTSSPPGSGFPGLAPTDVAGKTTTESYRTFGNDLRISYLGSRGTLTLGLWAEESWQTESRDAIDLSTGRLYDANKTAHTPVYFDFESHLHNIQPYLEYSYQLTEAWRVRAGVKWQAVTRDFDAAVIQNFLPGTQGTVARTVSSTLPSFDSTYRLTEGTNVYAQVSKGALVPSQSFLYTADPALGDQADPQTSVAEQAGIVSQAGRLSIGVDVYNIDFDNYVSTITENGNTLYVNSGRVWYRGIETEDHLALGAGFTAVVNASLIRATYRDSGLTSPLQRAGDTIPYAPRYIGLLGLVYNRERWSASLLAKFVGTEYQGKNGSADGATYRVGSYSYTNATLSRNFGDVLRFPQVRALLAVDNLWNSHAMTDNAGPSVLGPNLINVLPRRSFILSLVADF